MHESPRLSNTWNWSFKYDVSFKIARSHKYRVYVMIYRALVEYLE